MHPDTRARYPRPQWQQWLLNLIGIEPLYPSPGDTPPPMSVVTSPSALDALPHIPQLQNVDKSLRHQLWRGFRKGHKKGYHEGYNDGQREAYNHIRRLTSCLTHQIPLSCSLCTAYAIQPLPADEIIPIEPQQRPLQQYLHVKHIVETETQELQHISQKTMNEYLKSHRKEPQP